VAQVDPAAFHVAHVPPPYAYRCPFGTSTDSACGVAAAERVVAAALRRENSELEPPPRSWLKVW